MNNNTHDEFSCECHETCSWCTESVLESTLHEVPDGARICRSCQAEACQEIDDQMKGWM